MPGLRREVSRYLGILHVSRPPPRGMDSGKLAPLGREGQGAGVQHVLVTYLGTSLGTYLRYDAHRIACLLRMSRTGGKEPQSLHARYFRAGVQYKSPTACDCLSN